jgi:hypothetical protein
MSALGQKRTSWGEIAMSALPPKADNAEYNYDLNSRGRPAIGRTIVAGHDVMIDRLARLTRLLLKKALVDGKKSTGRHRIVKSNQ